MRSKLLLTNDQCLLAAKKMALHLKTFFIRDRFEVWGVPRGGVPVAYLLHSMDPHTFGLADRPDVATLFVDDIIDSGATRDRFTQKYRFPFLALMDFTGIDFENCRPWIVFPWEVTDLDKDTSAEDIVTRLLEYVGEDPKRGGLVETPSRVLKAWEFWTSGYNQDPSAVLKCFEDGANNYDEMVTVRELPFYSHCEHHLTPFFGTATIAYLPDKKVVGLSKLGRVLNIYARRLQVQERLTTQVADAIQQCLQPKGVGVIVKARHLCMESRGIGSQGHHTVTTALRGAFTEGKVRAEFLAIQQ